MSRMLENRMFECARDLVIVLKASLATDQIFARTVATASATGTCNKLAVGT